MRRSTSLSMSATVLVLVVVATLPAFLHSQHTKSATDVIFVEKGDSIVDLVKDGHDKNENATIVAEEFTTVYHHLHKHPFGDNNTGDDGLEGNLSIVEELNARFLGSPMERGKLCLKNVTKCLEEDYEYRLTTDKISKFLFRQLPPFDLSKVPGVSVQCKKHSSMYIQSLQEFKLWALKMYDSTGKVPSGLLSGNINQLGDFDQCLSTQSDGNEFIGQYCLSYMQIEIPQNTYLAALHRLTHSHYPILSTFDDPGHRVPRYTTVNWALCVPDSCQPRDVELGLNQTLKSIFSDVDIEYQIKVDPSMCQKLVEESLPFSTIVVGSFFIGIIAIAVAATVYDYLVTSEQNPLFTSFSLRRNIKSMISMKRSQDDIEIIHGIRFINAFMLILAHKSMALFFVPYVNRTEMIEYISQPWSVIGRAASLYTDPFIMFSGTLTAYSLFGKLQRNEKINIFQEYASRLFRLVPTLGALILFCTFILPFIGSGPQWNLVITHHADICKSYWWRNLLFIHNYFGFKDMCLTHTHHVGIDTQLFFISPLLIFALWKWPKRGFYGLITLATLSTILRYYVTYSKNLSNYIHFGTSIKQLFDTADYMYIIPAHRVTVYVMGIILGYVLRNTKNLKLNPMQIRIGNAVAMVLFSLAFFGPAFMGSIDYIYNPTHAAWYAAFAPIAWCLSFSWMIIISHIGYKDILSNLFAWKGFLVTTRLSYAIYLTQFPVFFYNVGITRSAEHYSFYRMNVNFKEQVCIVLLSAVLTLLFDTPFQNLKNIMFKRKRNIAKEGDPTTTPSEKVKSS